MSFLLWLDANPLRFWVLGAVCLAALVACAAAPPSRSGQTRAPSMAAITLLWHPAAFLVVVCLAILAFRWPALFFPWLLDHDEAQMGAQAIKYFTDVVPWRSVDGTTSGPLNSWWLMVPRLAGWRIDWISIRFMGLFCVIATIGFTYATFRCVAGDALARVSVLPMAFFYLFVTSISFLHYSSEHVPVMLLSGGFYFAARFTHGTRATVTSLVGAALLFGAVPFAKLQATPMAALGALMLLCALVVRSKRSGTGGPRARALTAWATASACVPLLVLLPVTAGGALRDFWISYLGQLTTYKQIGHMGGSFGGLLLEDRQGIVLFVAGAAVAVVLLGVVAKARARWRVDVAWAFAYLGTATFCVLWSGKHHPHYFLFWLHPICMCLGLLAAAATQTAPGADGQPRAGAGALWLIIGPVLAVQLSQVVAVAPGHPHVGRLREYLDTPPDPLVQAIQRIASEADQMTVWGLTPSLHVDTGLAPGTRDAISQMQILPSSQQAYYRDRFLNDLMVTRPKVFVDSDSPYLMMDGGTFTPYVELPVHGHEIFPQLAAFIAGNYKKVYEAQIGGSKHVIRIYSRQ